MRVSLICCDVYMIHWCKYSILCFLRFDKLCVLWDSEGSKFTLQVFIWNSYTLYLNNTYLDGKREDLSSGCVLLGLILLLAESGTLSLAMSMEAKWSDGVLEFWAAGLSGMNCCPVEMAEPPPFTALGLCHQYSFRCHREAAPGSWQEALPHTHFRLFPSLPPLLWAKALSRKHLYLSQEQRQLILS